MRCAARSQWQPTLEPDTATPPLNNNNIRPQRKAAVLLRGGSPVLCRHRKRAPVPVQYGILADCQTASLMQPLNSLNEKAQRPTGRLPAQIHITQGWHPEATPLPRQQDLRPLHVSATTVPSM